MAPLHTRSIEVTVDSPTPHAPAPTYEVCPGTQPMTCSAFHPQSLVTDGGPLVDAQALVDASARIVST